MNDSKNDSNPLPRPKLTTLSKPGFPKPASAQPTRDDRSDPTQIREGAIPAGAPPRKDESRFDATFLNEVLDKAEDFVVGRVGGRYDILRLIARGGMGEVWLAKDLKVAGRHVAIKRLTKESLASEKLRKRFEAEAESMAKLRHTHTIQVIDVGADENGPFICMEYVPGPKRTVRDWPSDLPAPPLTLQEYIDTSGTLSASHASKLLLKLCGAVQEAHSLQIIHRDIKPANVLMSEHLEPKLIDFGLARDLRPEESQHTVAGAQMLTIGYGAPEQEVDASNADERADVYALGAVLWFMVSGKNPRFYRNNDAPQDLQDVLLKALASDRDQRISSIVDLVKQINSITFGDTVWLTEESPSKARGDDISTLLQAVTCERKPGVCPYCSHIHNPIPESVEQRRYCGGCGIPLWRTCDSCQKKSTKKRSSTSPPKPHPVWERRCSQCGDDLFGKITESLSHVRTLVAKANVAASDQPHLVERMAHEANEAMSWIVGDCGFEKSTGKMGAIIERVNGTIAELKTLAGTKSSEADDQEWEISYAAYTPDAFEQYLKQYPQGIHADDARKHLEIVSLSNEVVSRMKDKQYKGLLPILDSLITLAPSAKGNWPDEKAAKLLANDKTCDASLAYLSLYPAGKAAKHAKAIAAVGLRTALMERMGDAKLRLKYLDCRQDVQLAEDTSRAWTWLLINWIVLAVVIAGAALMGLPTGYPIEIIAVAIVGVGVIIGLMSCSFAHRWARLGPLPALRYLLPPS